MTALHADITSLYWKVYGRHQQDRPLLASMFISPVSQALQALYSPAILSCYSVLGRMV